MARRMPPDSEPVRRVPPDEGWSTYEPGDGSSIAVRLLPDGPEPSPALAAREAIVTGKWDEHLPVLMRAIESRKWDIRDHGEVFLPPVSDTG